jgi:hypothetical protein
MHRCTFPILFPWNKSTHLRDKSYTTFTWISSVQMTHVTKNTFQTDMLFLDQGHLLSDRNMQGRYVTIFECNYRAGTMQEEAIITRLIHMRC